MTIDNIRAADRAAERMGQSARRIFDAVKGHCVAVPVVHVMTLPSHTIEVMDTAEGGAGLALVDALERSMGALAELIPVERAVVVSAADLAVLLAVAKQTQGRAALWDAEDVRERGLAALDAWAWQRGREIDGTEQ